jgi:hypothetical protein
VLSQVGGDASKELAQVVEEFEEKLQLALEYETRAFQPIGDERLLITTLSPETKAVKEREVVFGERMQDFQQIVEEEEAAIESLWRQWEGIQIETVCLAIEVLGSNEVILKEEDKLAIAPEKIDGAIQCYTQHQDALREALDKITAMEGSVKNVASQTIKTLRAQQKVKSRLFRTLSQMAFLTSPASIGAVCGKQDHHGRDGQSAPGVERLIVTRRVSEPILFMS